MAQIFNVQKARADGIPEEQIRSYILQNNLKASEPLKPTTVAQKGGAFLNSLAKPFYRMPTGATYELARAIASKSDPDVYLKTQNPFLTEDQLSRKGAASRTAKDAASIASWGVPIGKATKLGTPLGKVAIPALSATKGGAVAGLLQGLSADNVTPGGVLTSAVTGGVTGGVLNKILGGAGNISNKADDLALNMKKGVIKPEVKGPQGFSEEFDLVKFARDEVKAKGTPQNMRKLNMNFYNKNIEDLKNTFNKSNVTIPKGKVMTELTDLVEQGTFYRGNKADQNLLNNELKILLRDAVEQTKGGQPRINGTKLSLFKEKLARGIPDSAWKDSTVSDKVGVRMDLYKAINKLIDSTPGWESISKINSKLSKSHDLSAALLKVGKESARVPFIGTRFNAAPLKALQDAGASGVSKVSNATGKLEPLLKMLNSPTAVKAGAVGASNIVNAPQQDQNMPIGNTYNSSQTQQVEQPQQGITDQQLMMLILSDPKNASLYEKIAELSKGGAGGDMDSALVALNQLENLYFDNNSGKDLSLGDRSVGVGGLIARGGRAAQKTVDQEYTDRLNTYNTTKSFLIGVLNKAREAGVLNEGEYQTMVENMPNEYSTKTQAQNYFNEIRKYLQTKGGGASNTGSPYEILQNAGIDLGL